jgi:hypothetical protein
MNFFYQILQNILENSSKECFVNNNFLKKLHKIIVNAYPSFTYSNFRNKLEGLFLASFSSLV